MIQNALSKYDKLPRQVRASFWFVICGFLLKAVTLLTTPIFSRVLTTSEYGVFSVFITWQSIIALFVSLNLGAGVYLRGLIKYKEDNSEFTTSLQSLYIINAVCTFLIYALFSNFWNHIFELPTKYVICMFVDILMQVSFQFWSAKQRVEFKYKALVVITLTNAIIKPGLGIFAVVSSSDKVSARIYSMVLADILVFGYFFIKIFIHKGKKVSTVYWKYALSYNLPLVPHYLSQIVLNQSDRIMINAFVGAGAAGIYSLAYNAAAIFVIINQAILNSYNPWMYQKIRDKEYNNIGKYSFMLLVSIAVLNLMLIALAPETIALFAPSSYYEAIWVIPPVSMSVFFMFMYSLFANFELYYEKTKLMMIASVAGALLNVILNYIFIPMFGFLAAGYTTLFCYICYSFFHCVVMINITRKELPGVVIYSIRIIILLSIIFVLFGFMFMMLYNQTLIRYFLVIITALMIVLKRKKINEIYCKIKKREIINDETTI